MDDSRGGDMGIKIKQVKTANELWLVHHNDVYVATIFKPPLAKEADDWLLCWEDGRIDRHDSFESASAAVSGE